MLRAKSSKLSAALPEKCRLPVVMASGATADKRHFLYGMQTLIIVLQESGIIFHESKSNQP
jgi:hypothetical protein